MLLLRLIDGSSQHIVERVYWAAESAYQSLISKCNVCGVWDQKTIRVANLTVYLQTVKLQKYKIQHILESHSITKAQISTDIVTMSERLQIANKMARWCRSDIDETSLHSSTLIRIVPYLSTQFHTYPHSSTLIRAEKNILVKINYMNCSI